ncbi:MAG: GNAT family N-acetyltransferase [Pseudomonadota bacterium]
MTAPHELAIPGPAADFGAELRAKLPVIETARLRLRAPVIEDFGAYAEIATGPSGKFLIEEPNRENAWFDFTQMIATWLLRGHGLWSVETRAGQLVGFVLLGFEPGDHEPELGYMLRPGHEGNGYAEEAARAAMAHAFGPCALPTLVSTIDHENARSIALAGRLGGMRDAAAEAAHGRITQVHRYEGGSA